MFQACSVFARPHPAGPRPTGCSMTRFFIRLPLDWGQYCCVGHSTPRHQRAPHSGSPSTAPWPRSATASPMNSTRPACPNGLQRSPMSWRMGWVPHWPHGGGYIVPPAGPGSARRCMAGFTGGGRSAAPCAAWGRRKGACDPAMPSSSQHQSQQGVDNFMLVLSHFSDRTPSV
jgi:hypothetical protein